MDQTKQVSQSLGAAAAWSRSASGSSPRCPPRSRQQGTDQIRVGIHTSMKCS